MVTNSNTYCQISGVDLNFVTQEYLIDLYPSLVGTFKQSGLWMWGHNIHGQLGDNTTTRQSSPIQTISGGTNWKLVSGGFYHTAAIKTDGTLWTWGHNANGQLGANATTHRSSPVQTVSTGTNWTLIASGGYHTAAIKTDGTLWTWGHNANGQLGDNSTTHRSSPVQTVSTGTNWKLVSSGLYYTAAIKTDGTLWAWGHNGYGQLGDNTTTFRSSPVQTVATGTNWEQISLGGCTAAIKTDGTLWTWGYNLYGAVGDNTTTNKSSPVQTISSGTNWRQVGSAVFYTAAIKTDGTLWLWGQNFWGGLGDNSTTHRSSPVQTVSTGTNWKQVAGGLYHTTAIKTDGTLWIWGSNQYGGLGDDTTTYRSSPIQTVTNGTNWKQLGPGYFHTCVIRDDSSDIFGDPI